MTIKRIRSSTLAIALVTFAANSGCDLPSQSMSEGEIPAKLVIEGNDKHYLYDHDFGKIIASGQKIEHDFKIVPESKKDRVTGFYAATPCCTGVHIQNQSNSADGPIIAKTEWKLSVETGRKRAVFWVQTGDTHPAVHKLELVADLLAEIELKTSDKNRSKVPVGDSLKRNYTIIRRSSSREKVTTPVAVDVGGGCLVQITSTSNATRLPTKEFEIWETKADFEVSVPPVFEAGIRRNTVAITWSNGEKSEHVISNEYLNQLYASPQTVSVESNQTSQDIPILIGSRDGSNFRVIGLAEPKDAMQFDVEFDGVAASSHSLKLRPIKPLAPNTIFKIAIKTDHKEKNLYVTLLSIRSQPMGSPPGSPRQEK